MNDYEIIRLLRTHCLASAPRSAHSFARSLTHSGAHGKVIIGYELHAFVIHFQLTVGRLSSLQALRLRYAKAERDYRLEYISNSDFSQHEYEKWVEAMTTADLPLPTIKEVIV